VIAVVDELADDGAAGFPARSGDDELHAREAYAVRASPWPRIRSRECVRPRDPIAPPAL
jgi:hypothetical protein